VGKWEYVALFFILTYQTKKKFVYFLNYMSFQRSTWWGPTAHIAVINVLNFKTNKP
jgi:hypothetical protein